MHIVKVDDECVLTTTCNYYTNRFLLWTLTSSARGVPPHLTLVDSLEHYLRPKSASYMPDSVAYSLLCLS